jgi:RES domain-containing protein
MGTLQTAPHAEFDRIAAAAARLFAAGYGVRVCETVYRAAHPSYSDIPDLISGAGSMLRGSRWNPPGGLRVLHASDAPEHAIAETLANYRKFGLPLPEDLHLVVRASHCDVRGVLDLGDGAVRHALRVSEDRMLEADWQVENAGGREAVSQAVGRAAARAGFAGLLAPSAAVRGGLNIVVFMDRLGPPLHASLGRARGLHAGIRLRL